MTKLSLLALLAATTVSCSEHDTITESISRQFKQTGRHSVDLHTAVPQSWNRVCILGPYSDKAATHATLGFKWDSDKVSDVATNDGIVLLAFVDNAGDADKVAFFTNYPRGMGDFSNLSRRCFARPDAKFEQVDRPLKGWPGLFHAPVGKDIVSSIFPL
ncbi:hypothetical protein GCM10007386_27550 [Pseudoduganella dura]|nr:hypothetical protein GCM10007386_27550 [Pseudoduganella dura]